ncbi:MAG: LysM peptidoglycan-binding domain-containing protein [Bacteroidetes bacterium]|nr:LysM peptidoglycan-binding domain-containing protein [Bacteroidota bacterium]
MEIRRLIFITIISFFALAISAQSVIIPKSDIIESRNGKSYYVHTVQKGQTVYSISRAYGVTPDEIYFENPGTKQAISINQSILIPTVNKETELKEEVVMSNFDFFYHVASNNETFEQISSIYLIPEKYIVKANPNLHSPFREGEYVKVPVEDAFDILDGKVTANIPNVVNTRTSTYKSPIKKPSTTAVKRQVAEPSTKNSTEKTKEKPKSQPIVKKTGKPDSETVSFDPEIPVIQDYRHVVILGETTQSIAKKYDIPVELLKAANPGLSNSVVKGDRLRIPDKAKIEKPSQTETEDKPEPKILDITTKDDTTSAKPTKQETEVIKHMVKKKETLYSIGREYGLTVAEIIEANPGLTSSIKIGQIIIVPKKKISNPYIIHKVTSNTKVRKIAKLYRIHAYEIKEFNPDLGNKLYTSQEIKIPVGSHAIIIPSLPVITEIEQDIEDITDDDNGDIIKTEDCDFSPDMDRVFKVALMIPLSLEEADSLNHEQFFMKPQPFFKPFRFIQFYEGALIALDSLAKQGVNVEFFVYDVDKNITKTIKVLQQKELRTMDLIIGPFFNNSFNQVALFAGNFNIPVVNPLSYRSAVVNDYNTVIKIMPSGQSQIRMLETFISNSYNSSKVFLISENSYEDADMVTEVNNGIMSTINNQVKISNEELINLSYSVAIRDTLFDGITTPPSFIFEGTEIYPEILENNISDSTVINNYITRIVYSNDSLYPFYEKASPIRNNIVVLYGSKKSFILDVLNRLNESRDTFDIKLIGMPSWERINNLSNVKMNNLKLNYFSSSYVDYELDKTQDFIYMFRNRFNTEPDTYAFSGFDITYYFISSLFYMGNDFSRCLEYFPMELLQGTYSFNRVGNTNNFENNYWNMLQLKKMSESKVPDYLLFPINDQYVDD